MWLVWIMITLIIGVPTLIYTKKATVASEKWHAMEFAQTYNIESILSTELLKINIVNSLEYTVNILLYNKSKYKIMSLSEQQKTNDVNCIINYRIGTGWWDIMIFSGIDSNKTWEIYHKINFWELPLTGNIEYSLKCVATPTNEDCPMYGNSYITISYEKNVLSGASIFLIAQNPRMDELIPLDPIIDDFKSFWLIPKTAYTVRTVPNDGVWYLFYNETKYAEDDETVQYIKKTILSRFTHFNSVVLLPLSKQNFNTHTYMLDNCIATNVCTLSNYRFNKLNERKNPFTHRMMEQDENLNIDFIVLIPRLKN